MIEFLSNWAKSLGLAIVVVAILEMLLPNNKSKKYIRMIMGIYIVFSIISPFTSETDIFVVSDILEIEEYTEDIEDYTQEINPASMEKRIEELYIEEIQIDIKSKIEELGYIVESVEVSADIENVDDESRITKIELDIEKNKEEDKNINENTNLEDKLVEEIEKVKSIDIYVDKSDSEEIIENEERERITTVDIQNVKKFLIEEYGVNEKCLEIK